MSVYSGPNTIQSGLVLHLDAGNRKSYPGTGTTWFDLSGNNNHGTLTNGPTFNSANGGSIVFDGTNDHILLPNGLLSGTGDFTVNQFISHLTGSYGATFGNYMIGTLEIIYGPSFIGMWLDNSSTYLTSPAQSYKSSPTMITASRSGTITRFYIDGVLRKTGSSSSIIGTTSDQFRIGTNTGGSEQFNGRIFTTQVYNRALSQIEIDQNFSATRGRYGI